MEPKIFRTETYIANKTFRYEKRLKLYTRLLNKKTEKNFNVLSVFVAF